MDENEPVQIMAKIIFLRAKGQSEKAFEPWMYLKGGKRSIVKFHFHELRHP